MRAQPQGHTQGGQFMQEKCQIWTTELTERVCEWPRPKGMHEKCLIWTTGRVCKHGGLDVGGKIRRKGFCPSTQIEILWHRWNAWKVFALNNWTELNWSGLRRQLSKLDHTESWIIGGTLAQQTSSGECHSCVQIYKYTHLCIKRLFKLRYHFASSFFD